MTPAKHLLVDGSNVLRAWPDLGRLFKQDREAARARLSQILRLLHDHEGIQLTIVFDGRGSDATIEKPLGEDTFIHIFTPAHLTADDVIEHFVAQVADPGLCWVATDDRAERRTIEALGGTSLSTAELAEWVERTEVRQRTKISGLNRAADEKWRRDHGGGNQSDGRR